MLLEFDTVSISTERRELRRNGKVVAVQPQVFDLLIFLIGNRDRVVSRDDLLEGVWQGRIVSESTLASRINAARIAIGDDGEAQRFIRTIRGKGFRFVGTLDELPPAPSDPGSTGGRSVPPARIGLLLFDADSAYHDLSHRLREALAEDLSRNPFGLRVTALERSLPPPESQADRVDLILDGSLHREGDEIQLAAHLLETKYNTILSVFRRATPVGDPVASTRELAEAVTNRLFRDMHGVLSRTHPPAGSKPQSAHEFLTLAMSHNIRRNLADNLAAEDIAQKGIARFEDSAPLYAYLSFVRLVCASSLWRPAVRDGVAAAREAASRAIALDSENSLAHQMLALSLAYQGHKEQGLLSSERAISTNPAYAAPYRNRSVLLAYLGRIDDALQDRERATEMSPNAWISDDLDWGRLLYLAGRYDEALPHLERYAIVAPFADVIELVLAACCHAMGQTDRAADLVAEHLRTLPWSTIDLVRFVTPYPEPQRERFCDCLRQQGLPES